MSSSRESPNIEDEVEPAVHDGAVLRRQEDSGLAFLHNGGAVNLASGVEEVAVVNRAVDVTGGEIGFSGRLYRLARIGVFDRRLLSQSHVRLRACPSPSATWGSMASKPSTEHLRTHTMNWASRLTA